VVVDWSEMRAGGSAGNTSLALTGLGGSHRFVASTGNDANGAWLRAQFDAASGHWIVDDCNTTVTVGMVHKGGDRVFFTASGHLQRAGLDDLLTRLPAAQLPAMVRLSGRSLRSWTVVRLEIGSLVLSFSTFAKFSARSD
jgi:sugar/nucleoside kinase (ribokinase family)